jgi:tetratricopeptide (TPR) repeat protein
VIPVIGQFLDAAPQGKLTLEQLAAAKSAPENAQWVGVARTVAQHCEWGGQPGKAFDLYMKLAVCGEVPALDRLLALNPGLNRDGDLLAVLRLVAPVKGRPELQRQLAKMCGEAAEYDEAEENYRGWLADHPRDVEAWTELGALYEEQSKFDAALSALRTVLRIEPANLDARKEIADIQISLRQFREAFDFYHTLPEEQHDPATLENYALLAESLADYGAFNRALVLRQHRLKSPTTQDFLELARSFEVIGDTDGLLRCYQGGLRQFPKSRILKIELAGAYRKMGAYDEAVALLAVPQLKSDMHAMQLFIEVACLKEDYQFALAFLGQGFENHFAFGPETRLDLGHIYFNNGYLKEADELYSSVPDEPALWPLLASARFKRGDFASAEKYQRKHLAALQVPDAQGWLFLGDILKSQGREAEANQAYAKSLQLMEDKIESVSAEPSSEPKHASLP